MRDDSLNATVSGTQFAIHSANMSSSVKRRKFSEDAPAKVATKVKKAEKPEPEEEKSSSPEPATAEAAAEGEEDAPEVEEKAAPKTFKELVSFDIVTLKIQD